MHLQPKRSGGNRHRGPPRPSRAKLGETGPYNRTRPNQTRPTLTDPAVVLLLWDNGAPNKNEFRITSLSVGHHCAQQIEKAIPKVGEGGRHSLVEKM